MGVVSGHTAFALMMGGICIHRTVGAVGLTVLLPNFADGAALDTGLHTRGNERGSRLASMSSVVRSGLADGGIVLDQL